ncbi:MAG: PIN domain-containing protein [Microthrixaceae bacterium]|nr:PIN domain-containing protein [Microthrixaceae bacterium]
MVDEAVVVDTSAWIEFLKSTGSAVHRRLVEAVESETTIVVPEVVRMELLIGGTSAGPRPPAQAWSAWLWGRRGVGGWRRWWGRRA